MKKLISFVVLVFIIGMMVYYSFGGSNLLHILDWQSNSYGPMTTEQYNIMPVSPVPKGTN